MRSSLNKGPFRVRFTRVPHCFGGRKWLPICACAEQDAVASETFLGSADVLQLLAIEGLDLGFRAVNFKPDPRISRHLPPPLNPKP